MGHNSVSDVAAPASSSAVSLSEVVVAVLVLVVASIMNVSIVRCAFFGGGIFPPLITKELVESPFISLFWY
jgi:hypothetical protein